MGYNEKPLRQTNSGTRRQAPAINTESFNAACNKFFKSRGMQVSRPVGNALNAIKAREAKNAQG